MRGKGFVPTLLHSLRKSERMSNAHAFVHTERVLRKSVDGKGSDRRERVFLLHKKKFLGTTPPWFIDLGSRLMGVNVYGVEGFYIPYFYALSDHSQSRDADQPIDYSYCPCGVAGGSSHGLQPHHPGANSSRNHHGKPVLGSSASRVVKGEVIKRKWKGHIQPHRA